MNEPVAHRFKWEEQEEWQYGDGYDATGAPNDLDYFAYEPLYVHPMRELTDEEVIIPRFLAENYLKITETPRFKRILEDSLKKASGK